MLHELAQIEIRKLEAHGIASLTYDEVASLQSLAEAVDAAVRSEGLPVGLSRPVLLCDGVVLWPLTLAASAAWESAMPWMVEQNELTVTAALAWLMANGRNLDALRDTTTDRRTFMRCVRRWVRRLPVTLAELAGAVEAVFDAEETACYRADKGAREAVIAQARAAGDDETAEAVERLDARLVEALRKQMQRHVARPSWGAMTLRLAALTGCPPDAWAVQPAAEAIDAYAARIDFAALSAGALAATKHVDPAQRAQVAALKRLFVCTDAIARAHAAEKKEGAS